MSSSILPLTDSFAMQRCLTWATPNPTPIVPAAVPKTQHYSLSAAPRNRPVSAPLARAPVTVVEPLCPQHSIYRQTTVAKTVQSNVRTAQATRPTSSSHYCSLHDTRVYDYYLHRHMPIDPLMPTPPKTQENHYSSWKKSPATKKSGKRKSQASYKIAITTGDQKNAGTDARVFITIKGSKTKLPKHHLAKKSGSAQTSQTVFRFNRGTTHIFNFDAEDVGDLVSIVMEHDGVTENEGWFLEKVKVAKVSHKSGREHSWVFICQNWLSLHVGDCQRKRQLFTEQSSKTEYEIVVVTGNSKGAGTEARVSLTIFGKSGQTPKLQLKNSDNKTPFCRNQSDVFFVKSNCVGPMTKIRVEHDNTGIAPGWFLDRIVVTDLHNKKWKYYFPCNQWLAKDEGDGLICRDLVGSSNPMAIRKMNKYKITIFTGDRKFAGTDANVFVTLFGDVGESGERKLDARMKNNFERGQKDEFQVECPVLGTLQSLLVRHDNSGSSPGWYLDKIIVDDTDSNRVYVFPCDRWLAKNEDDGKIALELFCGSAEKSSDVSYEIRVKTGDVSKAGTSAGVYIVLYGGKKDEKSSGKIWLSDGKFERGRTDVFNIEVPYMLSPLSKIDIGHDNEGAGAGWFLDEVVVNCPSTGCEQTFTCGKWLAKDEGDKLIERTLYPSKRKDGEKKGGWNVYVHTGDEKGAGTDANVFMVVYGKNKNGESIKSDEIKLENKGDTFETGQVDKFSVDIIDIGRPYKIRIGHDGSKAFAAWFLDKVELEHSATKRRYTFNCGRWLAKDEDDGSLVRELPAEGEDIKKPEKVIKYAVTVHTGKKTGAGTDANVFLNIFGEQGDTGERDLEKSSTSKNKFEKGSVDKFIVEAVNLKELKKIRIGHDGKNPGAGWFLDKIVIHPENEPNKATVFECNRWLDKDEDDGLIVREIKAGGSQMLDTTSYHVSVKTGDCRGAGTDANVFLKVFGEAGDTGKLQLKNAENSKNKFERAMTDLFKLEATDIGKIKKIQISHDGSGPGAGWFLDEVKIDVPSRGESYLFACHRWLDTKEEDGKLEVEIEPSSIERGSKKIPYELTVWTGDKKGAGTDANVFIQMYGESGKTEEHPLRNRTDNFEQGQVDKFKIELDDVGPLLKIRVGHDGKGAFAGWFLDKILIQRHPSKNSKRWQRKKVPAARRPSSSSARGSRKTYDKKDSDDSESEDERMSKKSTASSNRRQSSGRMNGSRSPRGRSNSVISDSDSDSKFKRKASTDKGRKQSLRKNEVSDSDENSDDDKFKRKNSTDKGRKQSLRKHNVSDSDENSDDDDKSSRQRGDPARRKSQDKRSDAGNRRRTSQDESDRGKKKSRDDSDQRGKEDHVDEVEEYWFVCNKWFAKDEGDHKIVRELLPTTEDGKPLDIGLQEIEYVVKVVTGKERGAGTDANVYITITGELGDTGERHLNESTNHRNKFESNQEDIFKVNAIELGKIKKVKIRHDNSGRGAAWFLGYIQIEDPKNKKTYVFPCERWLATDEDDGQISRQLLPADEKKGLVKQKSLEAKALMTTYNVSVFTGDKFGAGTDANVYIVLFGEIDDTGVIFLKASQNKNKFERNQMDKFVLETIDTGEIRKIKIGHDNAGGGGAWYLERVEIDSPSLGKKWFFPHGKWLAKDKEDGKLERELYPQDMATEEYNPCIPYEITTYTSNKSGAGTEADVYVVLYSRTEMTSQKSLCASKSERKSAFKKGECTKFIVELEDIGEQIEKLRIGHDGSGIGAGWHLEKVEVRRLKDSGKGSKTFVFPCNRWLAKDEEDHAIERELVPKQVFDETKRKDGTVKREEIDQVDALTMKKYTVNVVTGDEKRAGTDANVFLTIYGDQGDCGERPLKDSATNKNKFEKGQTDRFCIEAADLGKIYKIKIRHDNSNFSSAWYLDRVEVIDPDDDEMYTFHCERWLAKDKDDGKIERTLYAKGYRGDMSSSTLHSRASSSMASLDTLGGDPFSKSPRLSKHRMSMEDIPEGPTIPYTIKITTGSEKDMGTDANCWIKIYGIKKKHTGKQFLELSHGKGFRPGAAENFSLEAVDVLDVKQIELGHDGVTDSSGWYVKEVEVDLPTKGKHYFFTCKAWLAKNKSDGKTSRIFNLADGEASVMSYKPMVPYEVSLYTGDVQNGGTDAEVYIKVFGSKGSTSEIKIDKMSDRFERGKIDLLKLEFEDIAPLKKLRVGTNGKGNRPDWFLEKVEIRNMNTGDLYTFIANAWFSKTRDDKQIVRDIPAMVKGKSQLKTTTYKISVMTSDEKGAGTDANVFVVLFGEHGDSGEIHLKKSETNKNPFENKQTDVFTINEILSLGRLNKVRVWHDDKGFGAAWHLAQIDVEDVSTGQKYLFPCNRWLSKSDDDKQICRELVCSNLPSPGVRDKITYEIDIKTSDKQDAGTIHNAWLVLEGDKNSSSEFLMENTSRKKILQRGQKDSFTMVSRNLGELRRCILGAIEGEVVSRSKSNNDELTWHCQEVVVTNQQTGDKYIFPCNDWIKVCTDESRKKRSAKVLQLKSVEESAITAQKNLGVVKYNVKVVTGNEFGCGTNANVFITLYGSFGDSGKRPLTQKNRDLFERNQTDEFQIEVVELGDLKKIKIEHDNSGIRPGWMLDHVEIRNLATDRTWMFPCGNWLDKSKGDKQIARELLPRD